MSHLDAYADNTLLPETRTWPRWLIVGAFVLVWGGLTAYAGHCDEPPTTVTVDVGTGLSMSDDEAAVPVAHVVIDAPVFIGSSSQARIRAAIELQGSPDSTEVNPADVRTFQGQGLDVQLERRIGADDSGRSSTYVLLQAGGQVRRDARAGGARTAPSERFPGWLTAGVAIDHRDDAGIVDRRLTVAYGMDQLSTEGWSFRVLVVTGHVRIGVHKGAGVTLGGALHRPVFGEGRSVAQVYTCASWGK